MRHLRTLFDLGDETTLQAVFRRAQQLKNDRREQRLAPSLAGRVVAMLFEQESTRTRVSFEAGVALLGGSTVALQARDTQLAKGEPLRDAARVLGGYVDALVVRSRRHEVIEEHARHAKVPVINGLSDLDHPCQVATDLFTVFERRESPFDLTWAWIGDGNHMANGFIAAATLLGFELRLAVPEGHAPDPGFLDRAATAGARVHVTHDPEEAVRGAHVISTDEWTTLDAAADAAERQRVIAPFQVNAQLLAGAADDHFVLHCLPANRGEEITDDVLEGRHSVVFHHAHNPLPFQQALLEWLLDIPVF
jgi:ornithine carbamoyltransferase